MDHNLPIKLLFATITGGMGLIFCLGPALAAETALDAPTAVPVSPAELQLEKELLKTKGREDKEAKKEKRKKAREKEEEHAEAKKDRQILDKSSRVEDMEKPAEPAPIKSGEKSTKLHPLSPSAEPVVKVQPDQAEMSKPHGKHFSGNVSWYGPGFNGKKTASGERFDMMKKTAAHRTLPFFTRVLVEDPKTGKTVVVKVNDRGPFVHTRVMDLSREGARQLGTLLDGTAYVDCLVIKGDIQE